MNDFLTALGDAGSTLVGHRTKRFINKTAVGIVKLADTGLQIGRVCNPRNESSQQASLVTTQSSSVMEQGFEMLNNPSHLPDSYVSGPFKCNPSFPKIRVLHEVYYSHEFRCLYEMDGSRIDSSFNWSRYNDIPSRIEIPNDVPRVRTEFVYVGDIEYLHYGHFLIEGIARLWGLKEFTAHPIIYSGQVWTVRTLPSRRKSRYIDDFLQLAGIYRNRLNYFDQSVILNTVVLPEPSFIFGQEVSVGHKYMPEFVAEQLFSKIGAPPISSQPAYFSRTKLKDKNRNIHNEESLVRELEKKGVKIYYPEALSLAEQIQVVNRHGCLIGCQGSSLHNILFSLRKDTQVFCLTNKDTRLDTFYMVDWLKKLQSHYVLALQQEVSSNKSEWMQDKTLNVSQALEALKTNGII